MARREHGRYAQQVTERLERKLQETKGLDFLRSYTIPGRTTIFVNLKGSTKASEVPDIWYQVRKNIGDIRSTLPAGVVGPGFNDDFGDTFGLIYGFTADGFTQRELRDYVEDIRSRLLQVPDVSKIELLGAQDERIYVEFSTKELAELGVDRAALLAALRAQNAVSPAGALETGDEKISLRVSGAFGSEQDLLNVNVLSNGRLIRLRDIATVRRAYADPPQPMFRVDGKPAIGLAIAMRDGGDILALGRNVKKAVDDSVANLPLGIDASLVSDQPVVVQTAIGEFMESLWQAIAIIMAVSIISLGLRPGSVVALTIPLTIAIVFPIMQAMHIDLQRISLGALIISLSLLVDSAMTTIDVMTTRLAQGDSKEDAASFAYKTLAMPMLTGTFVTIAGFVPIGFARSAAGEYTFSIFAVVTIALIVSWFVAVLFAPLLGVWLLKAPKAAGAEPNFVMRGFRSLLVGAMRMRWITIAVTLACFAASILALPYVPRQFFPASDRPELVVDLTLPQNASIYASETASAKLDAMLAKDPDVASWSTYVGRGAIRFYLPLDVKLANDFFSQAVVIAKDVAARDRLHAKLEKALAEQLPNAVTRVSPLELGPPVGWPVQYRVSGPDPSEVRAIALKLGQTMGENPNLRLVNFDWMEPAREVRVRIDQDQARLLGLSSQTLAETLNAVMSGTPITQVRDGIYLINVVARANDEQRVSLSTLRSLQLPLPGGRTVPLSQIATFDFDQEYPLIWRRDRVPTLTVQADVRGDATPEGAVQSLKPGHRETRSEPAERLPRRGRRHGRGERAIAGFGVCAAPGRAVPHAAVPDGAIAQLRPRRACRRDCAARIDRHRACASSLQPAARIRGNSRHSRSGRHDRAQRGHFDRPDRDRAQGRSRHLDGGRRGDAFPLPPDHADRDLDRAWPHPDRADRVLGADGLRHHGRPVRRHDADAAGAAGVLHHALPREAASGDGGGLKPATATALGTSRDIASRAPQGDSLPARISRRCEGERDHEQREARRRPLAQSPVGPLEHGPERHRDAEGGLLGDDDVARRNAGKPILHGPQACGERRPNEHRPDRVDELRRFERLERASDAREDEPGQKQGGDSERRPRS